MGSVTKRGNRWQLRVKHKLLQVPYYSTFDTKEEAEDYGQRLGTMLASGVIPQELAKPAGKGPDPLLIEIVREYTRAAPITSSDDELLTVVLSEVKALRVSGVTFQWADEYVRDCKVKRQLAPGTIRKRVGVLARVLDWHLRRVTPVGGQVPANPLRLLPRGYSAYSAQDAAEVPVKRDVSRDRRLTPAEDQAIRQALAGVKREDRQRPLQADPAFALLYALIVDTGLRLSEAFRLRVDQVDIAKNIINVEGSKGHRGYIKPRVVPLKVPLRAPLQDWCRGRVGLLFPFWDGSPLERKRASQRLSSRFSAAFAYAGAEDLTEHDLRHEACCRWLELRDVQGRWVFSEVEICKIMGWSDMRQLLRYASLRAENLSARLG